MFGTDGIRGVANREITAELCFKLGRAAGQLILEEGLNPRIVLGRDTRRSGRMLAAALAAGCCQTGKGVLDAEVIPTGGVSFLTRSRAAGLGIVLSASHNPASDNGIKFFAADGTKVPARYEKRLVELLDSAGPQPTGEGIGTIESDHPLAEEYLEFLLSLVPERLDGMVVAVDGAHGAGYELGVKVFTHLGALVLQTGVEPNGMNINDHVGATYPSTIQELTKSSGAAFGVAYDGDADRAVFSDHEGRLINGDRTMALWCDHWASDLHPKAVVGTVMSNGGFADAMAQRGITLHRANVGDKYVAAMMAETGAKIGGEQSGHLIFAERGPTGDGLITALEFARVLRRSQKNAAELFDIYEAWPQLMANIEVADKAALSSDPAIQAAIVDAEGALGQQGRINVRPSGTQPMVRVMVEASSIELRDTTLESVVRAIEQATEVERIKRVDLTHALGD